MKRKYDIRKRMMAATPIICLIIFLLLGFSFGLWHPGWMVFFLIPLMPFLVGYKRVKITYPLVCVVIYLIIGFAFSWWHPGWLIFLTIPVFEIFAGGVKDKKNDEDDDDEIVIEIK